MSQAIITKAFTEWKARQAVDNKPVVLDEFIFAYIPGLDTDTPIDNTEATPETDKIVHRQVVSKSGVVNENAVVYSVTLGADVGDFDFNWIGLVNKATGTLAMIIHAPTQRKVKNASGQQGNVLVRSMLMEYSGAKTATEIMTPAETWQIDFTARLAAIDERQRRENIDLYGIASFFDTGYLVAKSGSQFYVTKGAGYVAGLRSELAANQNINVTAKPVKVWLDVCWTGTLTSEWGVQSKITVAENVADYVSNGVQHYVFALAGIDAAGNITDLRPKGTLDEQQASDALKKHEQSRNHPDATTTEKGFTRLSSATDSDSEELAATLKAVKIAMDNASARLAKDRNGSDIPNIALFLQNLGLVETINRAAAAVQKSGDTMKGGLTMVESDIVIKTSSADSPQYTIINTTTGASVNIDLVDRRFRIFGVPWGGGPVKQFTFDLETGEFSIPHANIRFGSGIIQADANIYGAAWGENGNSGWINIWINNRINDVRTWVNQNFVNMVRRGDQASMVMDGGLVEAPAGCFLTGGNGNEGNQVGIALYRSLQTRRDNVWAIIEN